LISGDIDAKNLAEIATFPIQRLTKPIGPDELRQTIEATLEDQGLFDS